MITKVRLKNWRSHLNSELNLSEGTNCFVGPIGSGKTSTLDAICFAFFGTFPQLQQKKIKLEDVIMKKPMKKEEAEVTVFFDIGGDEWSIKRTIKKGRTTAELRRNGELIEGPQTSKVTSEVIKTLKVDYELFSRAIYSEQNQLDMFLTIPKGQRMKKIDQLLAIDKFEKARANTRSLVNKCSMVSNEKQKLVESLKMDEGLLKFDQLKRELLDFKNKKNDLEKQLERVRRRKEKTEKDVLLLKDQQKRLQDIEEGVKRFTALLELVESDLEKIKEDLVELAEKTTGELKNDIERLSESVTNFAHHLEEEKKNFDKLKESYAEDNAKINLIESERLPKLQEFVEEFDKIINQLKKYPLKKVNRELEKNKKLLEKQQIKFQKLIAKSSEIEESLHELTAAGSLCPVCDTKLTTKKKKSIISKKKKQIEDLKKETRNLKTKIVKTQNSVKKLEKRLKQSEKLQERFEELKDSKKDFKTLTSELKKLTLTLKAYTAQKKMFEKNISLLERDLDALEREQEKFKQMLSKREEADRKLELMKSYKQKITQLGYEKERLSPFSPSILERIEAEFQSMLTLEREIETRLESFSSIIGEKQKLLGEIENKRKILEDYKLEIRKIEAISEQLQLLSSALVATQEQLRKDFVLAVNQAMQSIWNDIYPYKDIYSIRLGIEGGDYVLQLQDSTGWIVADGIASGGERAIACLVLRIAFSLVLAPQLKWLVLDEPTANLDSRAIEELANVLRERISQLVEQCFLITHDEKLKEAVSGFCYTFERDKSKDGFTKITLMAGPEG